MVLDFANVIKMFVINPMPASILRSAKSEKRQRTVRISANYGTFLPYIM